ncbi:MAG: exodeoxyribonuclease III, partial [Candidatus Kapaibacterium sp.]
IVSWNVNGIRAAHKKGFMDFLRGDDPDVICLQEVRAEEHQIDEDKRVPEGYHAVYVPHRSKKGYSGVGLYSKRKPVQVHTGIGIEEFDREGRIVGADFEDVVVFGVYFPKAYSEKEAAGDMAKLARLDYKLAFYDAFFGFIRGLQRDGRRIVVCGDYNTAHEERDLARPKQNTDTSGFLRVERDRLDVLVDLGFVDTFREVESASGHYTWWSQRGGARENNVGWRIDYHWMTKDLVPALNGAAILPHVTGSDHCPVTLDLSV